MQKIQNTTDKNEILKFIDNIRLYDFKNVEITADYTDGGKYGRDYYGIPLRTYTITSERLRGNSIRVISVWLCHERRTTLERVANAVRMASGVKLEVINDTPREY